MPRHILFVQGAGAGTHDQWDNKLVESLEHKLDKGDTICYPRMPNEGDPHYSDWKAALLKQLDGLVDNAILIGHSVGGTVLLHVLADAAPKFRPGALILIAPPFIGEGGWPSDDIKPRAELAQSLPSGLPILIFHGYDDQIVPPAHAQLYAEAIPGLTIHALPHRNHQLSNDATEMAQAIRALPT